MNTISMLFHPLVSSQPAYRKKTKQLVYLLFPFGRLNPGSPPSFICYWTIPSSPTVESPTNATSQWCPAPSSETIKPDGLQALRKKLQQRIVSGKAAEIILKSWSAGTLKQYSRYITQWISWVVNGRIIPMTYLWRQFWIFLSLYMTKDCLLAPSISPEVPSPLLPYNRVKLPLVATHSFQDSW